MNDQSGETREETIINALREVTSETLVATLSLQPTIFTSVAHNNKKNEIAAVIKQMLLFASAYTYSIVQK